MPKTLELTEQVLDACRGLGRAGAVLRNALGFAEPPYSWPKGPLGRSLSGALARIVCRSAKRLDAHRGAAPLYLADR